MCDKGAEVGPYIVSSNELKGFVLSIVSRQDMIMFVLQDFKSEVRYVRNINPIVLAEKSTFVHGPIRCRWSREVCSSNRIKV